MRQKQKRRQLCNIIEQGQNTIRELMQENTGLKMQLISEQHRNQGVSFLCVEGRYENNKIVVTVKYNIQDFCSSVVIDPMEFKWMKNKEFYCKRLTEKILGMFTGCIAENLAVGIGGALEHSSERIDYCKVIPLRAVTSQAGKDSWQDISKEDVEHSRRCMACRKHGATGCLAYTPNRREVCQYFEQVTIDDRIGGNYSVKEVNDDNRS